MLTKGGRMRVPRLNALRFTAANGRWRAISDTLELEAPMESHCRNGGRSASEHACEAAPRGTPGKHRCARPDQTRRARTLSQAVTRRTRAQNPGFNSDDKHSVPTLSISFACHGAQAEPPLRSGV